MRTEKALAPELLEKLLQLPVREFNLDQVAAMLDCTILQARNTVIYGVNEDLLRVDVADQPTNGRRSTYENPKWRNKWIRGQWKK